MNKKPTPSYLVDKLSKEYRGTLYWNTKEKKWYIYKDDGTGIWSRISKEKMLSWIMNDIENLTTKLSYKYLNNIAKLLKIELFEEEWDEDFNPHLVCLKDCVYNTETGETTDHNKALMMTKQLPYTRLEYVNQRINRMKVEFFKSAYKGENGELKVCDGEAYVDKNERVKTETRHKEYFVHE